MKTKKTTKPGPKATQTTAKAQPKPTTTTPLKTSASKPTPAAKSAERAQAGRIAAELATLAELTIPQLHKKYEELFGRPAKTHNRAFLRKRIAFRIQELAEGGLSQRALDRIEELAPLAPVRWNAPTAPAKAIVESSRDPRLPAVGTILTRLYGGTEHQVTVLADGFEYKGERFRSLSKIAGLITRMSWNGYTFFGLNTKPGASTEKGQ